MKKWFIIGNMVFFAAGMFAKWLIDRTTYCVLVKAPAGYEIKSGYREPYFNDKGQLHWKERMSFKEGHWQSETRIWGSGAIPESSDTLVNDYVYFIRKKR